MATDQFGNEIAPWQQQSGMQIPQLLSDVGISYYDWTPAQEFAQFANRAIAPRSPITNAFWGAREPITQMYNIAQAVDPWESGTFADFMGNWGGGYLNEDTGADTRWSPYGPEWGTTNLRERAEQINMLAQLPTSVEANLAGGVYGDVWSENAPITQSQWDLYTGVNALNPYAGNLLYTTYGTGAEDMTDPLEEQRQLVNLLALQRSGGGMYGVGSRMGTAITSALERQRQRLQETSPETNFLDWYLQRTAGQDLGQGRWAESLIPTGQLNV